MLLRTGKDKSILYISHYSTSFGTHLLFLLGIRSLAVIGNQLEWRRSVDQVTWVLSFSFWLLESRLVDPEDLGSGSLSQKTTDNKARS